MPDGKDREQDGGAQSAEFAIEQLRKSAEQTIGAWTDDRLDAVIARLRQESAHRPDNFALLMFLEDARLRRHELRSFTDGKRDFPKEAFPPA
jgi:hypothetical protein